VPHTDILPSNAEKAASSGRVALVTGAGRGLGRAMALGLVRHGIRVVATAARERAEIEALAAEAGDGVVLPVLADVTREGDAQRVVDTALERFGRLDILVNNAGRGMKYVSETFMTEPTRFWEVEPKTWRMVIDTNVNGPFLMARAAAPHAPSAAHGAGGMGPHRQRLDELFDHASAWLLALWSVEGGAGIRDRHLGSGLARDRGDGQRVAPWGATLTGMIPDAFPEHARGALLDPAIMVPPLLWLVSNEAGSVSGCRVTANQWDSGNPLAATESAGWGA
jgi:hypothetical protein